MITRVFISLLTLHLLTAFNSKAQESKEWDNQMYFINKVGWGNNDWKFSGELQTRLENNAAELQSYHIEFIASYLPSNIIEVMPDFRYTVRPTRVEYRPGLGVFFKQNFKKAKLVHQVKGQYDLESSGYDSFSIRYGIFYHQTISKSFLATIFGGGMYEIGEVFTDWWGFRMGTNVTYIPDKTHAISLGYMLGAVNKGTYYSYIGIATIGLVINIKSDNKYSPAKYLSF